MADKFIDKIKPLLSKNFTERDKEIILNLCQYYKSNHYIFKSIFARKLKSRNVADEFIDILIKNNLVSKAYSIECSRCEETWIIDNYSEDEEYYCKRCDEDIDVSKDSELIYKIK